MRILLLVCLLYVGNCVAQKNSCAVAFYNVENLFDTKDDLATNDEEFTPAGAYRYTDKIYRQKLHNIATVIDKLDAVVVGLAEIENNTVLNDLIRQPELNGDKYKYAWHNSHDPRGIDVALLYNSNHFKLLQAKAIPLNMKGVATRDVLYVTGVLSGDTVHVLVNHWPSRGEGLQESKPKRNAMAQLNKRVVDSLQRRNKNVKIIIMGDLNDNPADESVASILGAKPDKSAMLYNPWAAIHKTGKGTAVFKKHWDHFDQVIISTSFTRTGGWQYDKVDIFDEAFIRNKGFDDAYPLRSFKGKYWNNGYSDHLPVILYLRK